jgi:hypothetical protein
MRPRFSPQALTSSMQTGSKMASSCRQTQQTMAREFLRHVWPVIHSSLDDAPHVAPAQTAAKVVHMAEFLARMLDAVDTRVDDA